MKTIFFDVDTQLDFLFPAGALYVPGAESITPSLALLTRFAAAHRIAILSTTDAHSGNDPEFKTWKPHCVVGTAGQQKAQATLLPKHLVVSTAPGTFAAILPEIQSAPQIIVEKQRLDAFTNPHLAPLLHELKADRYVLYGVVTDSASSAPPSAS